MTYDWEGVGAGQYNSLMRRLASVKDAAPLMQSWLQKQAGSGLFFATYTISPAAYIAQSVQAHSMVMSDQSVRSASLLHLLWDLWFLCLFSSIDCQYKMQFETRYL